MKKIMLAAAAAIAVFSLSSCKMVTIRITDPDMFNNYDITERSEDLSGFDRIASYGAYDVVFTQADAYAVRIEADEKTLGILDVYVSGDQLVLRTKDNKRITRDVKVFVEAPVLRGLTVNGASEFDADRITTEGDFDMRVNGAGDIDIKNLSCKVFSLDVNGAADVELGALQCENVTVGVNGAGDVDLEGLAVKGDVSIRVAGAADLKLAGKAGSVSYDLAGAASVNAKDLDAPVVSKRTAGMASVKD